MNVALVGFGIEGEAALKYWQDLGATITVCDQDPDKQVPVGVERRLGEGYLDNLDSFDVIWRSAGINPDVILASNPGIQDKITTTMNEFLRVCPTRHIIGVTGTKGKGTTSTLIAKMLEAADQKVFLGGNIGISPFDFLPSITANDWVVLELSSFQLCDIKYGPEVAVCLMVVPEHLNWHKDLSDYLNAKAQLFVHQGSSDTAIYFVDNGNSKQIASRSPGIKIPYFKEPGAHVENGILTITGNAILPISELKLLGAHNWQNVCAAITAVWQVTQDVMSMQAVLRSFSGLEHRLEFVREISGVRYYDDSFGTTPETAIVAIQAFDAPKVVIIGGSDKGASFDDLAAVLAGDTIRQVILIGNPANPMHKSATPTIEAAFRAHGVQAITSLVKPGGSTMAEVVAAAQHAAKPGDVVLLSTACASFDMFENYKDRGDQFKNAVAALPEGQPVSAPTA